MLTVTVAAAHCLADLLVGGWVFRSVGWLLGGFAAAARSRRRRIWICSLLHRSGVQRTAGGSILQRWQIFRCVPLLVFVATSPGWSHMCLRADRKRWLGCIQRQGQGHGGWVRGRSLGRVAGRGQQQQQQGQQRRQGLWQRYARGKAAELQSVYRGRGRGRGRSRGRVNTHDSYWHITTLLHHHHLYDSMVTHYYRSLNRRHFYILFRRFHVYPSSFKSSKQATSKQQATRLLSVLAITPSQCFGLCSNPAIFAMTDGLCKLHCCKVDLCTAPHYALRLGHTAQNNPRTAPPPNSPPKTRL